MCGPGGAAEVASDGIGIIDCRILEYKVGRRRKYHRFRVVEHTFKKDASEYDMMASWLKVANQSPINILERDDMITMDFWRNTTGGWSLFNILVILFMITRILYNMTYDNMMDPSTPWSTRPRQFLSLSDHPYSRQWTSFKEWTVGLKTSSILYIDVVTQGGGDRVILRPHSISETKFGWHFLFRPVVWVTHWHFFHVRSTIWWLKLPANIFQRTQLVEQNDVNSNRVNAPVMLLIIVRPMRTMIYLFIYTVH